MAAMKVYIQVAVCVCLLITYCEPCNVGLGNLGFGNVGVMNTGIGNKGVLNKGMKNIGVLNRKSADTIGVANIFRVNKIGVTPLLAIHNPFHHG